MQKTPEHPEQVEQISKSRLGLALSVPTKRSDLFRLWPLLPSALAE